MVEVRIAQFAGSPLVLQGVGVDFYESLQWESAPHMTSESRQEISLFREQRRHQ